MGGLRIGRDSSHTYTLGADRGSGDRADPGLRPFLAVSMPREQEFYLMGQVSASSTILINAEPDAVLAAVADYQTVRPKILSANYSGYQVLEGGQGAGTVVTWKLQATKKRVRDVKSTVDVAGHSVIEKDANSSMVTTWTVAPAGTGSTVTVKTAWQGAGGIGGFFEKTFAPLGLRKIQDEVLANLKKTIEN